MAYRLCRQMSQVPIKQEPTPPTYDFLGKLVELQTQSPLESGVKEFLQLLEHHLARVLSPEQKKLAENFWETHGPFSLEQVADTLERFTRRNGSDLHVDYYLHSLEELPRGMLSA